MSSDNKTTTVDGVERLPSNGIKVIIVGAGNGGLNAALECWRKGCDVEVLERQDELSRLGDFFTITPSALTTLKHYPRMFVAYHETVYDCSISVYSPDGREVKSTLPEWNREGIVHAAPDVDISFLIRRPVLAKMQLDQCLALGIRVHFGAKANDVEEKDEKVIVHTDKGDFEGDLCVASDGIGSRLAWPAPGGIGKVMDSGYAVARVAFPRTALEEGSPAEKLVTEALKDRPQFRTYLGDDTHLILFLTKDYIAWCFTHEADKSSSESWHNLRSPADLIPQIEKSSPSWDPAVLDFVRQTPSDVIDWRLMWRDGIEQWTSESARILKLGDAAHAFFPTAGNGAVQALEDGLSLAECLNQCGGPANVPWATRVHNKLRYHRVSILQQTGFLNREELHHSNIQELAKQQGETNIGFFKIGRWVWGHDPEKYAGEKYAACQKSLKEGKGEGWKNTNIPPGHVFKPWTMESEMQRMKEGRPSDLKTNGDWGY